jgi:hypothetical protein
VAGGPDGLVDDEYTVLTQPNHTLFRSRTP